MLDFKCIVFKFLRSYFQLVYTVQGCKSVFSIGVDDQHILVTFLIWGGMILRFFVWKNFCAILVKEIFVFWILVCIPRYLLKMLLEMLYYNAFQFLLQIVSIVRKIIPGILQIKKSKFRALHHVNFKTFIIPLIFHTTMETTRVCIRTCKGT